MGSKGSQTTQSSSSQTTQADPRAAAVYADILSRAEAASQKGYQPYTGQQVAGFSPDQLAAMQGVSGLQGTYAPMLGQAAQYATAAGQPISAAQINAAMSPYLQGVIQPTMDVMTAEGQKAMSRLRGTEAQQGAFGGTRSAVAEANLAAEQERNKNLVVADLMQKGYSQAVAQATADRQAAAQAAGISAGVAGAQVQTPLQALTAQLNTGALQQQLQQAQLNVPYQQFLQAQAYPYQQLSWLSGIAGGIGPGLGSTTTGQSTSETTPAQPSLGSQIFGGLMPLAALPVTGGGSLGGAALMGMFSDKRVKENIAEVGKLKDGQKIYKYNYKGDPTTHIGLIAQEVEKSHPEAVGSVGGIKTVNYDVATRNAAHKADGGSVGMGDIDIAGTMAKALEMASAEMAQPAQKADGGAVGSDGDDIVQGALRLAQTMKRGLGGAASHMADGGVPGATLGTVDIGGKKVISIFPSGMSGRGATLSSPGLQYARSGDIKTPDYSGVIKGLGAAFKYPDASSSSSGPMMLSAPQDIISGGRSADAIYSFGGAVPKADGRSLLDALPVASDETAPVSLAPPMPIAADETALAPIASIAPVSTRDLAKEARAIAGIESGGRYDTVGPVANKSGDRAYGKYQVMGSNIGPWTAKYYGEELSPQDFLKNPEAQEAVFKGQFGQYAQKYGPEGAARAWFAGERGMNDPNRRDVLGTTVADYSRKFGAGLGEPVDGAALAFAPERAGMAGSEGQQAILAQMGGGEGGLALPFAETGAGVSARLPTPAQAATANRATSIFENLTGIQLSDEGRMALMAMGLRMMSTPGSFGTALGVGGLQGLQTYAEAQQQQAARAEKEREYQLRKQQMELQEKRAAEAEKRSAQTLARGRYVESDRSTEDGRSVFLDKDTNQYVTFEKGTPVPVSQDKLTPPKSEIGRWKDTGMLSEDGKPILRDEKTGRLKTSEVPAGIGKVTRAPTPAEAAAEKAEAQATGKIKATAKASLPAAENVQRRAFELIDNVLTGDKYAQVTGIQAWFPTIMPSSIDTEEKLNQLNGNAFVNAFESIKGAGAITEKEGAAATAALARLKNLKQSDAGYKEALLDFRKELHLLTNVVRQKAGLESVPYTVPDFGKSSSATSEKPKTIQRKDKDGKVWTYELQPDGTYK